MRHSRVSAKSSSESGSSEQSPRPRVVTPSTPNYSKSRARRMLGATIDSVLVGVGCRVGDLRGSVQAKGIHRVHRVQGPGSRVQGVQAKGVLLFCSYCFLDDGSTGTFFLYLSYRLAGPV